MNLCDPGLQMDVETLNARISKLEEQLSTGNFVAPAAIVKQEKPAAAAGFSFFNRSYEPLRFLLTRRNPIAKKTALTSKNNTSMMNCTFPFRHCSQLRKST